MTQTGRFGFPSSNVSPRQSRLARRPVKGHSDGPLRLILAGFDLTLGDRIASLFSGRWMVRMPLEAAILAEFDRRPAAVLIVPTVDAAGAPTAGIVARCRAQKPRLPIFLVAPKQPSPRDLLLARLIGVGLYWNSSLESLRLAVETATEGQPQFHRGTADIASTLVEKIGDAKLVGILMKSARIAAPGAGVRELAAAAGIRPRALLRRTRARSWPPPRILVLLGRLLRFAIDREHGTPVARAARSVSGRRLRLLAREWEAVGASPQQSLDEIIGVVVDAVADRRPTGSPA